MQLKSELKEEKNKNNNLSKEISFLKEQIINLQSQINNQINSQINNQIDNSKNINKLINSNNPNETINKLIKEKEDLIEKLKRYPVILEKNEKLISIIFTPSNQNIHYSLICKNTDTIHKIEEELYKDYPELAQNENYFLYKGKVLNRFQPFEKNGIKNGATIILNPIDSLINLKSK